MKYSIVLASWSLHSSIMRKTINNKYNVLVPDDAKFDHKKWSSKGAREFREEVVLNFEKCGSRRPH